MKSDLKVGKKHKAQMEIKGQKIAALDSARKSKYNAIKLYVLYSVLKKKRIWFFVTFGVNYGVNLNCSDVLSQKNQTLIR